MKYSILALLLLSSTAAAGDSICSLDEQFRAGTATGEPCGKTSGKVLLSNGPMPRVKARMQSFAWKGKTFHGDGTFVNRWQGFEAVSATVTPGTSWLDGQPCLVMQYDEKAPIFGGVRDELRQVSPGVWLGRSYDGKTGDFKNYFKLEQK